MKICLKCPKSSEDLKNERSFLQHEKTHKVLITENVNTEISSSKTNAQQHLRTHTSSNILIFGENIWFMVADASDESSASQLSSQDEKSSSQSINVDPRMIRQFCRYCPYSNKPVIWAPVWLVHNPPWLFV